MDNEGKQSLLKGQEDEQNDRNALEMPEDQTKSKYKTTRYRWVILTLVFLASGYQMCLRLSYVPIASQIAKVYGHDSTTQVNYCLMINIFLAPFCTIMYMKILEIFDQGLIFKVSISIEFIGACFRMISFLNG